MLKITLRREGKGWTKARLARRAEMGPGDVSKIENGRLRPYPGQLRRLARALGVPPEHAHELLETVPARQAGPSGEAA